MNLEIGTLLLTGAKSIGETFLKEIKNKMLENQKITANTKAKIVEESEKIIRSYAEIYRVKNGEVYKYNVEEDYPETIEIEEDSYDMKNGFYKMVDGKLEYDDELTNEINDKIQMEKEKLIDEEKSYLESQRVEGEEYIVDEIGDDERYVFLTRKSNGEEFQEYNISEKLYNELLEEADKSNLVIRYAEGEYKRLEIV